MDRGAWWATVHGVTQSWTRLKWLSTAQCPFASSSWRRDSLDSRSISWGHAPAESASFCGFERKEVVSQETMGFFLKTQREGMSVGSTSVSWGFKKTKVVWTKRTLNKPQVKIGSKGWTTLSEQHLITHFHQRETSENETALHHYPCAIHVFQSTSYGCQGTWMLYGFW